MAYNPTTSSSFLSPEEDAAYTKAEAEKKAISKSKLKTSSNRIEDISTTKKIEDIPKPPISQPQPKSKEAELPAEVPFKPPVPGSEADKYFEDVIQKAVEETAIELAQTFVTEEAVSAITKRSIPWSLRDVDHQTVGGIYAQLGPGGTMIYGGAPESGTSGMDTDKIYIGGIEYTPGANPNDYDFLQIGADGSSSWIAAMISPMPTGYEIYNIRKNHIHITGATAGNI